MRAGEARRQRSCCRLPLAAPLCAADVEPPKPSTPRINSAPQTDIRMPRRHLRQLEDAYFNDAWQAAIEGAVQVGGSPRACKGRIGCLGRTAGWYSGMVAWLHVGKGGRVALRWHPPALPLAWPPGDCCGGQGLPRAQSGGGGGPARHDGAARRVRGGAGRTPAGAAGWQGACAGMCPLAVQPPASLRCMPCRPHSEPLAALPRAVATQTCNA